MQLPDVTITIETEAMRTHRALIYSLNEARGELGKLSPMVRELITLALEKGVPDGEMDAKAMRLQNRGLARLRLRAAMDGGRGP